MKILAGIKEWEIQHMASLDKKNQQLYLQGLTFKMDRLKNDYNRMPSTQAKQYALLKVESEIEQLKWRMKYIRVQLGQK